MIFCVHLVGQRRGGELVELAVVMAGETSWAGGLVSVFALECSEVNSERA